VAPQPGSRPLEGQRGAFDAAWTEIAGIFGHDAEDMEKARLRLTKALLPFANDSMALD
jgi:hypothetical protein